MPELKPEGYQHAVGHPTTYRCSHDLTLIQNPGFPGYSTGMLQYSNCCDSPVLQCIAFWAVSKRTDIESIKNVWQKR